MSPPPTSPLPLLHWVAALSIGHPTPPPAGYSAGELDIARVLTQAAPAAGLEAALRTWLEGVVVGYEGIDYVLVHPDIFPPLTITRAHLLKVLFAVTSLKVSDTVEGVMVTIERVISE
jgi:hypothetical protein